MSYRTSICSVTEGEQKTEKSVWLASIFSASGHTLCTIIITAMPPFCRRTQDTCVFFVLTKIRLYVVQALANNKSILRVQKRLILLG